MDVTQERTIVVGDVELVPDEFFNRRRNRFLCEIPCLRPHLGTRLDNDIVHSE